jgi:hypothetical protein
MKKLLIALFVSMPLVGCTQKTTDDQAPPPGSPAEPDPGQPADGTQPPKDGTDGQDQQSSVPKTEDNCLDGQDMDAADVDVKACPAIPSLPNDVKVGKEKYSLGAWELGTTSKGATYVYGSLSAPTSSPRTLTYEGGEVEVNDKNLECWAKGYYRLRKILQNPPAEYVTLRKAGFQYRFFQFQTDLRNGPTGYRGISSFQDHLVKWVTVISAQGVCQQPTLSKFREYAKSELTRRGLPQPGGS